MFRLFWVSRLYIVPGMLAPMVWTGSHVDLHVTCVFAMGLRVFRTFFLDATVFVSMHMCWSGLESN